MGEKGPEDLTKLLSDSIVKALEERSTMPSPYKKARFHAKLPVTGETLTNELNKGAFIDTANGKRWVVPGYTYRIYTRTGYGKYETRRVERPGMDPMVAFTPVETESYDGKFLPAGMADPSTITDIELDV